MFVAYIVVAVLWSLLLVFSGILLLTREKGVTTTLTELGIPLSWFPFLAVPKFAGAIGLLAGIFYRPLGIAAAIGVVLYFVGAMIAHLRVRDIKGTVGPTVLTILAIAPLVLGMSSM